MEKLIVGIACIIGGYVLAVFTWDRIHTFIVGAEAKALQLRDRAKALMAKVRAL